MSSALKPLTSAGAQNPPVPSQLNKPMHSQGAPTTYGQPMSHIPQNLVNIPHNPPSSASVHNPAHSNTHSVPHHINTNTHSTSHSANHYSLNVPNASQHYPVSGNTPVSSHSTSISSHPVSNANQSHTQPVAATFSSPPKNLSYNPPSFQASLGHSYKPMNVTSTQSIQNVQTAQAVTTATSEEPPSTEKPQSNGTPEVKTVTKTEPPQNHISSPGIKDKPPPPPAQTPPPSLPEKPKAASPEKQVATSNVPAPVTATSVEPKQNADVNKVSDNKSTVETVEKSSTPIQPATPTATTTTTAESTTTNSANAASNVDVKSSSETLPSSTATTVATTTPTVTVEAPTTETTTSNTVAPATPPPPPPPPPQQPPQQQQPSQTTTTNTGTEEVQEPQQEPATLSNNTTLGAPVQTKPKEQNNQKSTLKLATTPRMPVRKVKAPKLELTDALKSTPTKSETATKMLPQKSPSSGGKSKRNRIKTQPYQSPLPEVEMISKISATTPRSKNSEDKLIIFYKNEFLAVRNSEGGFYVCQAMQNIYKSSPRIRIRWLSQDKNDKEIYTPDFYDNTDFDCILTNLNLERVDKGKFRLPSNERIRTDSILKRALAVEKGDATPPSLTEEHPDGLDLSLYKEESQLKKRKAVKRKATTPLKSTPKPDSTKKSPDQAKVRKVTSKPKPQAVKKSTVLKRALAAKIKKPDAAGGRAERAAKRRIFEPPKNTIPLTITTKTSPVIDPKKAKVLAKVVRKPLAGPPPPPPKVQPIAKPQNIKSAKSAVASSSSKKLVGPPVKKEVKPPPVVTTRKSKRGKK